jgi:hypothetical protein
VNNSSVGIVEECLTLVDIILGHTRHDCHGCWRGGGGIKGSAVWLNGGGSSIKDGQLQIDSNGRSVIGGPGIGRGGVDGNEVDLSSDIVGGVEDECRIRVGSVGCRQDERGNLLSGSRIGHGAGNINVSWCTSHTHIHVSLVVGNDSNIVIITSTVSAVPVSTSMMSVTVVSIVIVGSLVQWRKLLLLHLTSRNDPDSVSRVARVNVDGSTVSVMTTVVVDDGIGVLPDIINNIDLGRVSLVVAINNHSVTVSASLDHSISMSTSLDDRTIVSVTSSLDNSGIVMASGRKE